MLYIALAIAIPFLFVIGTVYSAIKDQKKLERGALSEILSERQKKRMEHYKRQSENKIAQSRSDVVSCKDAPVAFKGKVVSSEREPLNESVSDDKKLAILKIDALIDSLENKHDDAEVPSLSVETYDSIGRDKDSCQTQILHSESIDEIKDTSSESIQKNLDEALSFIEDDRRL